MKKNLLVIFLLFIVLLPLTARRNIMMTGYWSPTSEMIYLFSNDPELNPDGWIGENWEDRGYDVYAFFPAFNRVTRDFEVDYQATWEDFWATAEAYNPIAIISYGAGAGPWEIEYNARNLNSWYNDYEYPYQPTPCPPDSTVPVNYERHATLPVAEIEAAVDSETPLNAWVDWNGNPGAFLCEYMAYLGMWYQDMHSSYDDEYTCLAAGFTHVNAGVNLGYATQAAEVALRTTIEYLNSFIELHGTVNAGGIDPEGTQIYLTNESGTEFYAESDAFGDFTIEMIPMGEYDVTAFLDRYFYYEGSCIIDSSGYELNLDLEEYPQAPALTWCSEPIEILNAGTSMNIITAAVFEPEDLDNYIDCHLKELIFTAPADSENCTLNLILYEGTPQSGEPMLILLEEEITGFDEGQEISFWIDEMNILTEESFENGLTFALQANSQNGQIGWIDEGPAISGKGNMIKVSGVWMEAGDMLAMDANWDLRLGFYGVPETDTDGNLISINQRIFNYPNPFNPQTSICFNLSEKEAVEVSIYNLKGELVKKFPKKEYFSGLNRIIWNGMNESEKIAASGIYFYKVKTDKWQKSSRMLLLK